MTGIDDNAPAALASKTIHDNSIVEGAPFPIVAAFFDIDGTLVGPSHFIAPRTKDAISKLKALGVSVGFATGRASFATAELRQELGISGPSMFFAGSLIQNPSTGQTLYRVEMSNDTLRRLIDVATTYKSHLEFYTETDFFAERITEELTIHQQYCARPARISPLHQVMRDELVIKAVMMARVGESEAQLRSLLASIPGITVTYSYGAAHDDIVFANIVDMRATREAAFSELLKIHQCSPAMVATFGDSEADQVFLRRARFGVATGNAIQVAKEAASYITSPVEKGGVGLAIEKLFLARAG